MARILRGDIYWADLNPVGNKNNPHIKKIRVVSTVEYYLSD